MSISSTFVTCLKIVTMLALLSFPWLASAEELRGQVDQMKKQWPGLTEMKLGTTTLLFERKSLDPEFHNATATDLLSNNQREVYFLRIKSGEATLEFGICKAGPTPYNYLIERSLGTVASGKIICIPGNGSVYVVKTLATEKFNIDYTHKYIIEGPYLILQKQDIIVVNQPSRVNREAKLFGDMDLTRQIATIPKDSVVTVVAISMTDSGADRRVLIRSQVGLSGWIQDEQVSYSQMMSTRVIDLLNYSDRGSS